ncbi:MAG: hypothetical protein WC878_06090 [Candidatus Paceibacterota bacterium]|jgi:hypothetical protein
MSFGRKPNYSRGEYHPSEFMIKRNKIREELIAPYEKNLQIVRSKLMEIVDTLQPNKKIWSTEEIACAGRWDMCLKYIKDTKVREEFLGLMKEWEMRFGERGDVISMFSEMENKGYYKLHYTDKELILFLNDFVRETLRQL